MTEPLNIKFDKRLFTDLFWKLREADKTNKRYILNRGSRASGKSHAIAQLMIIKTLEKKERILIVRKTFNSMRKSVILLIQDLLDKYKINHLYYYNKSEGFFKNKVNGSLIYCVGLDDKGAEKIRGLQGVTTVWIEESTELNEVDIDNLDMTMREPGTKLWFSFNPTTRLGWIYKKFYDNSPYKEQSIYFKTTYLDNPFLPQSYINQLERFRDYNYSYFDIFGNGNWGNPYSKDLLFKAFKAEKVVVDCEKLGIYNPNEDALHISFDENIIPYQPCTISVLRGNKIYVIDEITMEDPFNTIHDCVDEIKKRYPLNIHKGGIFLYGDATSRRRSVREKERGSNFFDLVIKLMSEYTPVLRLSKSNPPAVKRMEWTNQLFFGLFPQKIFIDESCIRTIEDFSSVKQAPDGHMLKQKVKDPVSHVSYEQYGHLVDCVTYMVCEAYHKSFYEFVDGSVFKIPNMTISHPNRY